VDVIVLYGGLLLLFAVVVLLVIICYEYIIWRRRRLARAIVPAKPQPDEKIVERDRAGSIETTGSWVTHTSLVDISRIDQSLLEVGKWGVVKVRLKGFGEVKLSVEGDVEWMCDESYTVSGERVVDVHVKPKVEGEVPIKVVAVYTGGRSSRLVTLRVVKRMCLKCGAPVEPGAKYCWKCGAKLE